MMSMRSFADFNGTPPVVAVCGWHLHRHHRGLQFLIDTTNTGGGTFIWPPVDTSTWPPVDTFSWPRTLVEGVHDADICALAA